MTYQQQLLAALQAQNGIQNQSNVYSQLQGVANGTGPNPAQAQLAQATGANTANQAALMASQRGASQNAGLIARQAAQQGAANQQQAAGQAATLQAQQSLNALQGMGQLSTNQVQQQANATSGYNQAAQGEQANLLNSIAAQNNANVGMQSNMNNANAGIIGATMGQQASIGSAGAQAVGTAFGGAKGGRTDELTPMAYGGVSAPSGIPSDAGGPLSAVGQWFSSISNAGKTQTKPTDKATQTANTTAGEAQPWELGGGMAGGPGDITNAPSQGPDTVVGAEGGKVPALLSPGERYLSPAEAKAAAEGKVDPMKAGKKVPGTPKVKGAKNSYANDTVKATLEEGGLVLPRSVTQSKDPHWAAMKFVRAHMAKSRKGM